MQMNPIYVLKIVVKNYATPDQWSVLFAEQPWLDQVRKKWVRKMLSKYVVYLYTPN